MFREMRRIGNILPMEETLKMLKEAKHGTLAVDGEEGYPYAVPISFLYQDNQIVFHCATEGHKLDAIRKNPKVSFCVIEQDNIIPEEFNTLYRSAIAFGTASILEGENKRKYIEDLAAKYAPEHGESAKAYINSDWDAFHVVVITIDHLTGKAGD